MPEPLKQFNINDTAGIEEIRVEENRIFDGKILSVRCDKVRTPSGRIATREVVEHKSAVGMLAVTDRESVLLVRQYRYAVNEVTLEICAGLVEKGEDPLQAAEREMQEELNVKPKNLYRIGEFYASPRLATFRKLLKTEKFGTQRLLRLLRGLWQKNQFGINYLKGDF